MRAVVRAPERHRQHRQLAAVAAAAAGVLLAASIAWVSFAEVPPPARNAPGRVGPVPVEDVVRALALRPGETLVASVPQPPARSLLVQCDWTREELEPTWVDPWQSSSDVPRVFLPVTAAGDGDWAVEVEADGGLRPVDVVRDKMTPSTVWAAFACASGNRVALVADHWGAGRVVVFEEYRGRWWRLGEGITWVE